MAHRRLDVAAAGDLAAAVVQPGGLQVQPAVGDQAAAAVGQLVRDLDGERATAADEAVVPVVQGIGGQVERAPGQTATAVVEGAVDGETQVLLADDLAASVVQAARRQVEAFAAGYLAAAVAQRAEAVQEQGAGCVDEAAIVVQRTALQVEGKAVLAEQLAALLGQAGGAQQQRAARRDTALGIGDLPRFQGETSAADQAPRSVVEGTGGDFQRSGGGDQAITVVQPGAAQQQAGVGEDAPVLVEQLVPGSGGERAGAGQVAPAVVEGLGGEGQGAFAVEQPTLVEQPAVALGIARLGGQLDVQLAVAGEGAAAVVQMSTDYAGPVPAIDQAPVAVEQAFDGEVQVRGQQLAAVAVVQGRGRQRDPVPGGEFAAAVVDGGDVEEQVAVGGDQAVAVVQGLASEAERSFGDQFALALDQGADFGEQIATAGNPACAVLQPGGTDIQAPGADQPGQVGEHLLDTQGEHFLREQLAAVVVQAGGRQGKAFAAGYFAAAVAHRAQVVQHQRVRRVDQAAVVVQRPAGQVEAQAGLAGQLAALLGQAAGAQHQRTAGGDASAGALDLSGEDIQAVQADHLALAVIHASADEVQRALRFEPPLAIAQLAGDDVQPALAGYQAGSIEQVAIAFGIVRTGKQFDGEALVAGQPAAGVVQVPSFEPDITRMDQALIAVEQALGGQLQVRGQQTAFVAVVQVPRNDVRHSLAGDFPAAVVDGGHRQVEIAVGGDQAVAVVQGLADQGQRAFGQQLAAALVQGIDLGEQIATAGNPAFAVLQLGGADIQAPGADQSGQVGENTLDAQRETLFREQLAAVVVQTGGRQGEAFAAGNLAAAVAHWTEVVQDQSTRCSEQPAVVVQRPAGQVEGQFALAGQLAALLVQAAGAQHQRTKGDDSPASALDLPSEDIQAIEAGQLALAVIQGAGDQRHRALALDTALAVAQVGAGQVHGADTGHDSAPIVQTTVASGPGGQTDDQGAITDQVAAGIVQALALQTNARPAGELATTIVDRFDRQAEIAVGGDQAVAVVQGLAGDAERTFGEQFATLLVQGSDLGEQIATAGNPAFAVLQPGGGEVQTLGADQPGQVGEQLLDTQGESFLREQLAAVVVQAGSRQGEAFTAGYLPAAVAH